MGGVRRGEMRGVGGIRGVEGGMDLSEPFQYTMCCQPEKVDA